MTESSAAADKAALRERLMLTRRSRTVTDIATARTAVAGHVLAGLSPAIRCVAGFEPLRTEPGSLELLDELAGQGRTVLVPALLADRDLAWRERPAGGLPAPELGVEAIARADLVLVPALAVGRRGVRLGRGGGSYDRALRRVRPGVAVVAVIFDDELLDHDVPRDDWDVAVTAVVSPSGWRDVPAP